MATLKGRITVNIVSFPGQCYLISGISTCIDALFKRYVVTTENLQHPEHENIIQNV